MGKSHFPSGSLSRFNVARLVSFHFVFNFGLELGLRKTISRIWKIDENLIGENAIDVCQHWIGMRKVFVRRRDDVTLIASIICKSHNFIDMPKCLRRLITKRGRRRMKEIW